MTSPSLKTSTALSTHVHNPQNPTPEHSRGGLDPRRHFSASDLPTICVCQSCKSPFPLERGIVFRGAWVIGNEKDAYFVNAISCSIQCLILKMPDAMFGRG